MLGRLTALTRLTAPALRRGIASTPTLFESHPDFGKQTKNVADADATIKDHITEMLKQSGEETPVFLFMKGEPSDPQCGFSNQVCRVLHLQGMQGRGEEGTECCGYWLQRARSSGFLSCSPSKCTRVWHHRRVDMHVLVFTFFLSLPPVLSVLSVSPSVSLVSPFEGVKFNAFNVLSDADVREGVKAFAEWPTIPQLYVLRDEKRDEQRNEQRGAAFLTLTPTTLVPVWLLASMLWLLLRCKRNLGSVLM